MGSWLRLHRAGDAYQVDEPCVSLHNWHSRGSFKALVQVLGQYAQVIVQFILNVLIGGAIYTLLALGFGLIYSTARFFHIAYGAIYTTAAYSLYLAYAVVGLPLWLAVLVALTVATALGAAMELLFYRFLRRRSGSLLIPLLASFGMYIVIQNLISLVMGDEVRSVRTGPVVEGIEVWGARIMVGQIVIVCTAAVLTVGCAAFLRYSQLGRELRAVANCQELARILGVDVDRAYLVVFSLGSALGAAAAILVVFETDMSPVMGFNAVMLAVIAVIIGGAGSITGAAIGGVVVALLQHVAIWTIGSQWQDMFVFGILVLFLLVRPQGVFGNPRAEGI